MITRSSGNVFADLGFPDAEERLAEMRRKMAEKRAHLYAKHQRRKPYRQKPDLPGMCKRHRRFGYRDWVSKWYGVGLCLIRNRARVRARARDDDEPKQRELKPRPPHRRNRKAYDRGRERAEFFAILQDR